MISSFPVQSVFEDWLVDRNLLVRDISLTKVNTVTFTKLKRPSYTRRRLLIYFPSQGKSSGLLPQWDVLQIDLQFAAKFGP